MKIQSAPELLTRGMAGEQAPNKGNGAGGDKAAAFGALLEIGKGKSAARGGQPMVEGGPRDAAGKPGERAPSDEKALTDDLPILAETAADGSVVEVDVAKAEAADAAEGVDLGLDQSTTGKPDPMVTQTIPATPDIAPDKAEVALDGALEAPAETKGIEPAIAVPADQSAVAVTSMALFFTLTNSLRTAGSNPIEMMRSTSNKSGADPVSLKAMKASTPGHVERVGDLTSALSPTALASLTQTMARPEALSVLEGVRAALSPSAGEAASPLVGGALPSGDNMAGLGQSLASLTPVTKQIQSVLVQQVASGDFASKVDEAVLARNATNARVNNGAIMVTLSPANLGEVTIKLVNRGDVVQIVLQASTDEAAGQIMRDRDTIADLVQTLARKSAHVVVQAGMETADGQTRAQEDGSRRGQSGDEGRPQSDMFGAGRDERGGRQHDPTPAAQAEPSQGGEILI